MTVESWGARLFGPCWVGYDAPRILFVFSRRTLQQFLFRAGFEIIHIGYPFLDFYPFLWSFINLCDIHIMSPMLRRLLTSLVGSWPARLLSSPFFALQSLLKGDSFVTVVARKV